MVVVAEGTPRPAVIVQSDLAPTPDQLLLCPLTTTLVDAPLYRLPLAPSETNGLVRPSHLAADQVGPARRSRIGKVIGRVTEDDMERLSSAIRFIMGLNG